MGAATPDPSRSEPEAHDGELSPEVHPAGAVEQLGPVDIRRFVKADGRSLVLYERERPGPPTR